jgi:hypothetical protein
MARAIRSKADLNRQFKSEGLPLELVKGNGYFYFVYDDGTPTGFDTFSVYVCHFDHLRVADWFAYGADFARDTVARLKEVAA